MPCSGDNYPTEKEMRNAEARELMEWLSQYLMNPPPQDDVGRLCKLIRDMGEDQLFPILKREFDDPMARRLAGWWEKHKDIDKLKGVN